MSSLEPLLYSAQWAMALHLEGGETLLILLTQQVNPPKEPIRAKMGFARKPDFL